MQTIPSMKIKNYIVSQKHNTYSTLFISKLQEEQNATLSYCTTNFVDKTIRFVIQIRQFTTNNGKIQKIKTSGPPGIKVTHE
jgi:hypothetical protein